MSLVTTDILFMAGGWVQEKHGTLVYRSAPGDRGGEERQETVVRAAPNLPSIGPDGRLRNAGPNVARFDFRDHGSGIRKPALRIDPPATNNCLASEDLNNATYWTKVTLTITPGALVSGALSLDLLSNAGTLSSRVENVSALPLFTTATPVWFFHAARGNYNVVQAELFDTVASSRRAKINITWNADGTIASTAITNGVLLETIALANGIYRFVLRATGVVLANTHKARFFPVAEIQPGTDVGTCYFGGVQVQDYEMPGAYAKTTTAVVTAATDTITVSAVNGLRGLTPTRDDFSIYAALPIVAPSTVVGRGIVRVSLAEPFLRAWFGNAGEIIVGYKNGAEDKQASATIIPTTIVECCAQYVDLAVAPKVRIDAGGGFSAFSATATGITDLADSGVSLGTSGAGADQILSGAIRLVAIARGQVTLAEWRAYFGSMN